MKSYIPTKFNHLLLTLEKKQNGLFFLFGPDWSRTFRKYAFLWQIRILENVPRSTGFPFLPFFVFGFVRTGTRTAPRRRGDLGDGG